MRPFLFALMLVLYLPLAAKADGGDNPASAAQDGRTTKVVNHELGQSGTLTFTGKLAGEFSSGFDYVLEEGYNVRIVAIRRKPTSADRFQRLFYPEHIRRFFEW